MMYEHRLHGCRPVPLAHYLKGLGVLRLVAEQADAHARGAWDSDVFVLHTELSADELNTFFLERYAPTPIVGPWGARSGFFDSGSEKSAREALHAIVDDDSERLHLFRATIATVRELLGRLRIADKDTVKARKVELLQACRAQLADEVVTWLDACYVLTRDGSKFPPLLGTGGNEGSGSYMSGFAQQVVECVIRGSHARGLVAALWDQAAFDSLSKQTPGHFLPSAVQAQALVNPWDYLLCLEGALLFAGALSRRNQTSPDALAYPFTVRPVAAGYGSAAGEKTRGEMWLPLWQQPIRLSELTQLLSEGRGELGRRRARDGTDFARAIATMGVDRGITHFQRYGFQERNGLSFFATPLNRLQTGWRPEVALLDEPRLDRWLRRFRRAAGSDTAPNAMQRALRALEEAILSLCQSGGHSERMALLIALGHCERVLAKSLRWTLKAHLAPIPILPPTWLYGLEMTPELRLAAALMSIQPSVRCQLEPVTVNFCRSGTTVSWDEHAGRDVVWFDGHLSEVLSRIVHRRLVLMQKGDASAFTTYSRVPARLHDIAAFIAGHIDENLLKDLLWSCALIDWPHLDWAKFAPPSTPEVNDARTASTSERWPGALYALLRLAFSGDTLPGLEIPVNPRIHRLASAGQGANASRLAAQRLRASGLAPGIGPIFVKPETTQRVAAALAFPISKRAYQQLQRRVCQPGLENTENESSTRDSAQAELT